MTTEQQQELAKEYFKSNPSQDVLHITTDGQVFFQKNYNDCVNHQRRILPTGKIVSIYRREIEKEAIDSPDTGGQAPNEKWTKDQLRLWLGFHGDVKLTGKESKAELLEMTQSILAQDGGNDGSDAADDNSDDQ